MAIARPSLDPSRTHLHRRRHQILNLCRFFPGYAEQYGELGLEQLRFPPGRPDLELYSQMLETQADLRVHMFQFGAHVYLNGEQQTGTYHHTPLGEKGVRPTADPGGFRIDHALPRGSMPCLVGAIGQQPRALCCLV